MALACVAHVADHMANDPRECMNDLHCKTKGVYQFPISVTIFLEGLCSILEELEDRAGRIRLFESGSKGSFREVYPSEFCVVGQGGIDYRLDVKSGRCRWGFLCSRRHEDNGGVDNLAFRVESSRREWKGGREKRGLGYEVMGGLQDAAAQAQDCEDLQSHTRQDSAYSCR